MDQTAYIRNLAEKVRDIAETDENRAKRKRWHDVNALRKPDRAPVYIKPVRAWQELLPDAELRCTQEPHRRIEKNLRRSLTKADIGDDEVIKDFFPVKARFDVEPPNVWGIDIQRQHPDKKGGAWTYDPPLKSKSDFEHLTLPSYTYNQEETERELEMINDLIGDILPATRTCNAPLSPTICTPAAELRGLTQLMMDLALDPDFIHRLMAYLRDAVLGAMEQIERAGILTPDPSAPMTAHEPFGDENEQGIPTFRNMFGTANSQEFDQVSPEMWEEFLLEYQKPILEKFGLCAYGCCEDLTEKIDRVLSILNLRIFVKSAWTDLDTVLEHVNRNYVIMWREKATDVVFAKDPEMIRKHLHDEIQRMQGSFYQIVLRELQTLDGNPQRAYEWTRFAVEATEKYAD